MSSLIRIYKGNEIEYQTLTLFADMVNAIALQQKVAIYMSVQDIYFDFGLGWKYSGLVTEDLNKDSQWQSLCPRDYELILKTDSIFKLKRMAWAYVNLYKANENIILYKEYE